MRETRVISLKGTRQRSVLGSSFDASIVFCQTGWERVKAEKDLPPSNQP